MKKCAKTGCSQTPVNIASNQPFSGAIAVDATNVYWSRQTAVAKCATAGCNDMPTAVSTRSASGIVVDATDMYWTDDGNGTVVRCAIGGCNMQPTELVTAQASPSHMAIDAKAIYWATATSVMMLAK